jgi:hypothetical protein
MAMTISRRDMQEATLVVLRSICEGISPSISGGTRLNGAMKERL